MPKLAVKPISSSGEEKPPLLPNNDSGWLGLVADKVNSLSYGVVQIVVHDGRVVQVERTERHRFEVRSGV